MNMTIIIRRYGIRPVGKLWCSPCKIHRAFDNCPAAAGYYYLYFEKGSSCKMLDGDDDVGGAGAGADAGAGTGAGLTIDKKNK